MPNDPTADPQAESVRGARRAALRGKHIAGEVPADYDFQGSVPPEQVTPIVFVGGTGRSGTHVIARMLGQNVNYRTVRVECRFHVEDRGFPGLLAGTTTKKAFLRRMRGFWWKGRVRGRVRGMHKFVPQERYDAALDAFDKAYDTDPEGACRELFLAILMPFATDKGKRGIIEQSCDSIAQAPTLVRLFPEARYIHVVRDGRDASASRVGQARLLSYPRTRKQGIKWWDGRIRAIDAGARAIPEGDLLEISLDELLAGPKRGSLGPIARHVGVRSGRKVRRFFHGQMDADVANTERWRRGLSESQQDAIDRRYLEVLEGLERDGITCAPLLRRTYERRHGRV